MSNPLEIRSKGFSFTAPVKENEPGTVYWEENGERREVTYLVLPKIEAFFKKSKDFFESIFDKNVSKDWMAISEGKETIYLKKNEWEALSDGDQKKLQNFFDTTFQKAFGLAEKANVEAPESWGKDLKKEAQQLQQLVKKKLSMMISAAQSSPKHISKMRLSTQHAEIIRCKVGKNDTIELSAEKQAGKGGFKTVRKVIALTTVGELPLANKIYAYSKLRDLKGPSLSQEDIEKRREDFRKEIENMKLLTDKNVKNIVRLYQVKQLSPTGGIEKEETPIGVLTEWCNLGDAKWITKKPPEKGSKEYTACISLLHDVAVGLASLHDPAVGFVHGDVKPENFFLSSLHGQISGKLGDLGSCAAIGQPIRTLSPAYTAPEILTGEQGMLTPQGDIWSFGISLLEMFHGGESNAFSKISLPKPPDPQGTDEEFKEYQDEKAKLLKEAIKNIRAELTQKDPIDGIIFQCLLSPGKRPTLQQVADSLQKLLPPQVPPEKPLSRKKLAEIQEQEEQRLQNWKQKAITS